ncbi:MAG: hypothetical protein GY769_21900 [bacterium]|nr:hypothetical protein [bacterium]
MPVTKYTSVAEMQGPRPLVPLDPENLRIACELTELAYGLRAWRLEAGVRKFGSADEAAAARQSRERLSANGDAGSRLEG